MGQMVAIYSGEEPSTVEETLSGQISVWRHVSYEGRWVWRGPGGVRSM